MSEGEANLRQAFENWCKEHEGIGFSFVRVPFHEDMYIHHQTQIAWLAFKAGAELIMYHPYG